MQRGGRLVLNSALFAGAKREGGWRFQRFVNS